MRRLRRRTPDSSIAPLIVWSRQDFQDLALIRLEEAQILLKNKKFDGAFYLCGYCVECALKACIAKKTQRHDFPPNRATIEKFYTHDISALMRASGLQPKFDKFVKEKKDIKLNSYYSYVSTRWNEEARYTLHSESQTKELFKAIANEKHGVLSWIKHYW